MKTNSLLIVIAVVVVLLNIYVVAPINLFIAQNMMGIEQLPIEFNNRLGAFYILLLLLPSLIVVFNKADSTINRLIVIIIGCSLMAIELSIFFDTRWNTDEISALRWFQSLWLIACSVTALLNYMLIKLFSDANAMTIARFWLISSMAFLYFAFDERFHLHEKAADLIANLSGISVDHVNGWLGIQYFDGLVMVGYLLLAIMFILWFFKPLINHYYCPHLHAYRYLMIGALFATLAILSDLELFEYEFQETIEELSEFAATSFFVLGFSINLIEFAINNRFLNDVIKKYNLNSENRS